MPLPRLQINVLTDDISAHAQEIEQIIKKLETLDTVTSKRFFPYAAAPIQDESEPLQGSLNLISLSSNP